MILLSLVDDLSIGAAILNRTSFDIWWYEPLVVIVIMFNYLVTTGSVFNFGIDEAVWLHRSCNLRVVSHL